MARSKGNQSSEKRNNPTRGRVKGPGGLPSKNHGKSSGKGRDNASPKKGK